MKFGKRLKRQIEETLPEWRDKFLSYKDLKQLLRLIAGGGRQSSGEEFEVEFCRLLDAEIEKLNSFFVEQEEDFIIRQKEIQERIQHAIVTWGPNGIRPSELRYADEMRRIRRDVVDFHGEMVLLENYSSINYTGLAKILKKYDKRNGALLRLPFIEKILEQPFFTTDLISKLVKECESTMDSVFPVQMEQQRSSEERDSTVTASEQSIYRNTVAALVTMHELRRGSSTYSHFSLPPMEADLLQSLHLPSPIPIL